VVKGATLTASAIDVSIFTMTSWCGGDYRWKQDIFFLNMSKVHCWSSICLGVLWRSLYSQIAFLWNLKLVSVCHSGSRTHKLHRFNL
jgi:hypothetical protein